MSQNYDIIIFGGGVAGLWIANRLLRDGYNVILFENEALGGAQTLASQGMIHGGQKYALTGAVTGHAAAISAMPERWEACLGGWGEVDLTAVQALSDTQVMWPAESAFLKSVVSEAAVFAAAQLVNAQTKKLKKSEYPEVFSGAKKFKGPVYELPEKVLETKSLVAALAKNLHGRIFKGAAEELLPDGQVAVGGRALSAQAVVFAAGTGNEEALALLRVQGKKTQRRALRQIMVRTMEEPLFGHGITGAPKPRVTVTSHPLSGGGFVWYLGGNIAEESAGLDEAAALSFAQKEMAEIFSHIDWTDKEWASWTGDRAEAFDAEGRLPPGPQLEQRGQVLLCWPTKLTFAPLLADRVSEWLKQRGIAPEPSADFLPDFLPVDIGLYPWEAAAWKKI